MSAPLDLDRAIDQLFRAPLENFVGGRDALAAELRGANRKGEAAGVKTLQKPSVTAWAVNQVWWTDRRAFQKMLDAGDRLREQQRVSLAGKPAKLREAVEARQQAIAGVVELAVRAMGGADRVSAPMRQRIATTSDALATGDLPEGTVLGRLQQDLQPIGFNALAAFLPLTSSTQPSPPRESRSGRTLAEVRPFRRPAQSSLTSSLASGSSKASKGGREAGGDREEAIARARANELASARAAVEEADAAVADAERELRVRSTALRDAEHRHATLQSRVEELEQTLGTVQKEEREARAALGKAKQAMTAAEAVRDKASRDSTTARRHLEQVRD